MFFENLRDKETKEGERPEVQWLGALPDVLSKTTLSTKDIEEIFGKTITKESYDVTNCTETDANARCYATVSKFIQKDKHSYFTLISSKNSPLSPWTPAERPW